MTEQQTRNLLVELGASLFNRRFSSGSGGNISVKLDDGTILATPTNSSLGRLVPGKISLLDADGAVLSGHSPSKECAFHLALYAAKPGCGAVVHLHSPYATALSCRLDCNPDDVIRPFTPYYIMKAAPLPLIPYFKPGSPKIAEVLAEKAATANCFLLANHGPVVTGKTLEDAVNTMEELEETARLVFLLRAAGEGNVRYLSDAEILELAPSEKNAHIIARQAG